MQGNAIEPRGRRVNVSRRWQLSGDIGRSHAGKVARRGCYGHREMALKFATNSPHGVIARESGQPSTPQQS